MKLTGNAPANGSTKAASLAASGSTTSTTIYSPASTSATSSHLLQTDTKQERLYQEQVILQNQCQNRQLELSRLHSLIENNPKDANNKDNIALYLKLYKEQEQALSLSNVAILCLQLDLTGFN